jgi:hypothetical protein
MRERLWPAARVHRLLILITAAGLGLRLLYAYALVKARPVLGDALEFEQQANLLAAGHGIIQPFQWLLHHRAIASADKPPLYLLLEAGLSLLGGRSWRWHDLVGIGAGTVTIPVVFFLGRRLAGSRVGALAAALCATYPLLIAADGSLRSESLFALLVTGSLLAALRARERPDARRLAALGVLVGLASLTRGEGLVLILLLPFAVARWRGVAVSAAACLIVLMPWFVRCWVVFGRPVLISTNTGGLLAGANCRSTYGGQLLGQWDLNCLPPDRFLNEEREAAELRSVGLRYARAHASRLPVVLAARLGRSFELFRPAQGWEFEAFYEGRSLPVDRLGVFVYWMMAPLALAGAMLLRGRGGPWGVLLAPVAMVAVVSLTAYGFTRFRVAAEPALIVLAAVALGTLGGRIRQGRPWRPGV